MVTIAVISFRLGGGDGVSIEATKWIAALRSLGHTVRTVAGEGPVDHLVPGLARHATTPPRATELEAALDGADLVIVENLLSLPLNLGARDALAELLRGRPALLHHHDLPWQREHLTHFDGPADDARWAHVTINEQSRIELAARGISAEVVRNRFDCDPPAGARELTRALLGVGATPLALCPVRAIGRKNLAGALRLAEQLGTVLWLLGPAEDGYDDELERVLDGAEVPVLRGMPARSTIHDAYAACDLVIMASTWEGFGNPVLESVTHRRPLALNRYPVALELLDFGFSFASLEDLDELQRELASPDIAKRDANLAVARGHFALDGLADVLKSLLHRHFGELDL
jgi:glycosyltransferase involved in cell wall biosynthesis